MKLYYVHDPMCSWCWAFRPVYLQLVEKLPKHIEFIRILGGLAPDSDQPMPKETQHFVIDNWQRIQEQLPDTPFNYDFWSVCQPRRSTYPSCRAVLAARKQGSHYDEAMTYAIQKAYYLEARNPSNIDTLMQLADETGLDVTQFNQDLISDSVQTELISELKTARNLHLNSFPSFLLSQGEHKIHINPDYTNADSLLDQIKTAL